MKSIMLFALCFSSLTFGSIPPLKLQPQLKQDFVKLISKAYDFHTALETESQKQAIQKQVAETGKLISQLYPKISSIPHPQQRLHSYKLLNSLEDRLTAMSSHPLNNNSRNKQKIVKKVFSSFFELAEVYNLKKELKGNIYYCSKDKNTWFQKSGKAKNPINSNFKNCGTKI